MENKNNATRWIYFFTLKSIKVPLLIIFLGMSFILLSNLNDYLMLKKWGEEILRIKQWSYVSAVFEPLGQTLIVLGLITAIYRFLRLYCQHKEYFFQENNLKLPILILQPIQKGLRVFYIFMLIYTAIYMLGSRYVYFLYLSKMVYVLLVLTICWIFLEIVQTIEHVISHLALTEKKNVRRAKEWNTKAQVIRNLSSAVIVFITIVALLMSFESVKSIGLSLLASAGFLTAIIGFSAQKTMASFFSGIEIVFSQRIKIGDYIVINDKQGIVEHITLTYVSIKVSEFRRVIIPIGFFIDKSFESWSDMDETCVKGSVVLYLSYQADLNVLRKELNHFLTKHPLWDKKEIGIELIHFRPALIEVNLNVSAHNVDQLNNLKSAMREHMLNFLRENHSDFLSKSLDCMTMNVT